jgi:hypothetical protein
MLAHAEIDGMRDELFANSDRGKRTGKPWRSCGTSAVRSTG